MFEDNISLYLNISDDIISDAFLLELRCISASPGLLWLLSCYSTALGPFQRTHAVSGFDRLRQAAAADTKRQSSIAKLFALEGSLGQATSNEATCK